MLVIHQNVLIIQFLPLSDVNDQTPNFNAAATDISITEDSNAGFTVLQLSAGDGDAGDAGTV